MQALLLWYASQLVTPTCPGPEPASSFGGHVPVYPPTLVLPICFVCLFRWYPITTLNKLSKPFTVCQSLAWPLASPSGHRGPLASSSDHRGPRPPPEAKDNRSEIPKFKIPISKGISFIAFMWSFFFPPFYDFTWIWCKRYTLNTSNKG